MSLDRNPRHTYDVHPWTSSQPCIRSPGGAGYADGANPMAAREMRQYEFRLLNVDGKTDASIKRDCEAVEAVISLARTLMKKHRYVEIWLGPRAIAQFPNH